MRFRTSPLKPAVPEQRLQSREGIFLSSQGKCSRVSCSLFMPPGPVFPQPPGSKKVHSDLLSQACQMHLRGCCWRFQPSPRRPLPLGAEGVTKGALLPAQPHQPGIQAGTDTLVLFMLLPVPPGDVHPDMRAKPGWQWVRQGGAIVRCCHLGLRCRPGMGARPWWTGWRAQPLTSS